MRLILIVFDAMRTFDRRVTRLELERETGLNKRQVENGLCALMRRGLLLIDGTQRQRGCYGLTPGAQRPEDLRGHYAREPDFRALQSQSRARAVGVPLADYSPARPPSHASQPGGLRLVVKGILDTRSQAPPAFARCELERLWKGR